ncbi:MAG: hypothetical protein GX858_08820 [Clostridiales bacterium]|nr:hypothetical protein [Clostridiales bacterium]
MDRKKVEEDKNHTTPNMNLEGMPWYNTGRDLLKPAKRADTLTKQQNRYLMSGALIGALLVAGVLSIFLILFVLFATLVWLK